MCIIVFVCIFNFTFSGLRIVYTLDEVAFVQNLVFYIESAYVTPVGLMTCAVCNINAIYEGLWNMGAR